jgi:cysteinyl-tRNA synthetase
MGLFDFFRAKKPRDLPPLEFYNTLSGELERFVPLSRRKVTMYNCGPTVYDRQHIGNLRPYIFADTLRRVLTYWRYEVTQVINITDVGHLVGDGDKGEDKMEMGARKAGRSAREIADEVVNWWFEDLDLVGVYRDNILFPRATEYIDEQIALIKALEEKGYAYVRKDGVYFDTEKFPNYGKLGKVNIAGLEAGARVEENPEKKNPHDFALWKLSRKDKRRQQEWNSPWGTGYPGWHIECTAMIFTLLGKYIDIHTGGVDHIPVHHNNEIAQAESITGKPYVRYWLHNEFATIEGKKVSKSIGNTVYLHNIIDRGFSPRALRYWYLTAHYRSSTNFTWEAIAASDQALKRLTRHYLEAPETTGMSEEFLPAFCGALADDLNTPQALALVWEHLSALGKLTLREVDALLGLGFSEEKAAAKLIVLEEAELPEKVQKFVVERTQARNEKDFARADALRKKIAEAGFDVKDTPEGPKITKK